MSVQQHKKMGESQTMISFSDDDLEGVLLSHYDPIVIELSIDLFLVRRILIDGGSSIHILYKEAFDNLKMAEQSLKPVKTSLIGLSGEVVYPMGLVTLPVFIREPKSKISWMSHLS
ncbi:hypothetical protein CFOL_v3_21116 [Cephalotus follicularis]|uniref:RVP_2 domain-containing protein n=1 Tax=Cephalotus follicularis TaxID=3775 RepID=A0A1Q3CBN2_CEPFO|nr:hypothetical protein CFOL_v3_21116 [Cephalotus follicularis]